MEGLLFLLLNKKKEKEDEGSVQGVHKTSQKSNPLSQENPSFAQEGNSET